MHRIMITAAVLALGAGLAACGSTTSGSGSGSGTSASPGSTAASCSNASIQKDLYTKGTLTVATDKPAYPPWFSGNDPANGKGYESAVAYAVAAQLGFKKSQVTWAYEPFNDSYAPGPKKFDFDINEVSVTPARAQAVTFSTSYYDVDQALVALKGTPIVTKHAPSDLKGYVFGDQIGTTSLAFINSQIQPTQTPKVYETPERREAGAADPPDRGAGGGHAHRPVHLLLGNQELGAGGTVPVQRRALRPALPQG